MPESGPDCLVCATLRRIRSDTAPNSFGMCILRRIRCQIAPNSLERAGRGMWAARPPPSPPRPHSHPPSPSPSPSLSLPFPLTLPLTLSLSLLPPLPLPLARPQSPPRALGPVPRTAPDYLPLFLRQRRICRRRCPKRSLFLSPSLSLWLCAGTGNVLHHRLQAKREQLHRFQEVLPESQGQDLALTESYVPCSTAVGLAHPVPISRAIPVEGEPSDDALSLAGSPSLAPSLMFPGFL